MTDTKARPRYAAPPRQVKEDDKDKLVWARTLGVTVVQLEAAIAAVGRNVNDIARHLIERDYVARQGGSRRQTV